MAEEKAATRKRLDFTNVKEGSGISKPRMPEGDYEAKITKVTESDKDGTPMWCFVFQLSDRASATYPYYCKLQENQLWKLRNLLIAAGKNVPKKAVNVDPNNLVGTVVGLTLIDAEWTNNDGETKEQSEINAVFPANELAADDADDSSDELPEDADEDVADEAEESGDLDLDDL